MLGLTLQEAAELQRAVTYANPAYEELPQYSEDVDQASSDIQQQLSQLYAAHEEEKQDAEKKVVCLQQQLEQAGMAHKLALAALQQEKEQADQLFSTLIQVGLHF